MISWGFKILTTLCLLGTSGAQAAISSPVASSDASNLYYQFNYSGTPSFYRVFLDTDKNASTGYRSFNVGADYLLENGNLYKYSGTNGAWGWSSRKTVLLTNSNSQVRWTVAKVDVGSPIALNYVLQHDNPVATSGVLSQTTSATPSATPASSWIPCAVEGATCSFSGTRNVRYGANGVYAFKSATGSIGCNNSVFGDPVPGVVKSCDYSSSTVTSPTPSPTPTPIATPIATPTPTPTPVSSGPVYYLSPTGNDANAGTSTSPWKTIQKAANTVVAGSTVILMNGTYEEPSINISRGGTATAPVTFKAQNKWMAVLASTSGCNPGFSINASYITLQDLRLSVSSRNANCSTYTSSNVHVRAWNRGEPTPSNPTTGYVGFVARGLKVDGTSARSEGMKSNQDFTIMENNEISASMELFNSKDSIIRNNNVIGQSGSGISIFVKGGLRNARIYGNIVHQKIANRNAILIGGYSCDLCHFDTSTNIEAYNVVAFNNVVINESGGGISALGFQGAKDSAFFNNIVINGQLSMAIGGHNTGPQAPTSNPTFKNNIVMCNGSLTSGYFGWSYSGTLNMDSNNFYNCSSAPAQNRAIVGNPLFVNPTSDWRLQAGSPAINSGVAVSMPAYGGGTIDVSRDFNGVLRSTPWDLGIYNVAP